MLRKQWRFVSLGVLLGALLVTGSRLPRAGSTPGRVLMARTVDRLGRSLSIL